MATIAARRALESAGLEPREHRSDRARDVDARQHIPGERGHGAETISASAAARRSTCRRSVPASSMRSATADALLQDGAGTARPGHRRGDVLAHPRLERPDHLRALRRRRRRGRAGAGGGRRQHCRPRHPDLAPSLGRAAQGKALRRRRTLRDGHGRSCAHGGARGLQARGRDDLRRDQRRLRGDRHAAPTTSTGSCRTRPTSASSTPAPRSSASREQKVVSTVDRHGNTSAASIPLALDEAVRDGRIKPGHLLMLEAMGGGFTWGSVLVRW